MTEICDVTGREYYKVAVRSCPHPAVIERYGYGGVANVCIYVCKKCEFCIREKNMDAVRCGYDGVKA